MKILIAEDNERMRKFIGQMVSPFADEVCECADGTQAVHEYDLRQPDWVLMDIEMQPMDGITATQQITQKHPEAKVLMVTRYDDPAMRERATQAGAAGYLLKQNLHLIQDILIKGDFDSRAGSILHEK